jgi:putative glycosyltransferase
MTAPRPALSVVTTLYRSAGTIEEFIQRAGTAARALVGESFEIVIVNEGSPDDSLERAQGLMATWPQLVLVDLSRNFGHHLALLEGMRQSDGELVYLIDSDLEEEPEWVAEFERLRILNEADVVFGFQEQRKGGWFERTSGRIYWSVFRSMSELDLPANVVTCRLMSRRYVDAVLTYGEREVSIGAIFNIAGFHQIGTPVAKGDKGSSSYSLRLKVWHLVNSISAFSTKPLTAIFVLGIASSLLGVAMVVYLTIAAVALSRSPAGWASVIASVWVLGGLILSSIGVLAIYIGKIFSEVKGRPRTVIRSIERTGYDES